MKHEDRLWCVDSGVKSGMFCLIYLGRRDEDGVCCEPARRS